MWLSQLLFGKAFDSATNLLFHPGIGNLCICGNFCAYCFKAIVVSENVDRLPTLGATEDTYIVRLEKNVPQRIRMFVWLEGQDVDCVNLERVINIALSIELAGAH